MPKIAKPRFLRHLIWGGSYYSHDLGGETKLKNMTKLNHGQTKNADREKYAR